MSARDAAFDVSAREARDASERPDAEFLVQLAAGDLGALGALYTRHQASVRRFVARATGDAEDVDDLVHATFLAAAQCAARYDGRASCRPWLLGIAVQLLRRRRRAFARFVDVLTAIASLRPSATDPRSGSHTRGDIERALSQLSEAKRITLLLTEVEELSCQEVAELLKIPIGTVWTRLHAARRELRDLLTFESER